MKASARTRTNTSLIVAAVMPGRSRPTLKLIVSSNIIGSCDTTAIMLFNVAREMSGTDTPPTLIVPDEGSTCRVSSRIKVVLPDPVGPTTARL